LLKKPLRRLLHSSLQIAPETLLQLRHKCWKCSLIGVTFAIGCRSPFGNRL
jgi:hypothetical protein